MKKSIAFVLISMLLIGCESETPKSSKSHATELSKNLGVLDRSGEGNTSIPYKDLSTDQKKRADQIIELFLQDTENRRAASDQLRYDGFAKDLGSLKANPQPAQLLDFDIACLYVEEEGIGCWFGDTLCAIIWKEGAEDFGCWSD